MEDEPKITDIDAITGYTKDWHQISKNFREKHGYTCEICGTQVSQFETEFMHVHHRNGNKTDNREENLQCLCIKCHSEVDSIHKNNFSTISKQLLLKLFMDRYSK